MKLQGVIILRVTDLRRFFDLTEFWQQRDDFVEMIKQGWLNVFCDTEEECELCLLVRDWILFHRTNDGSELPAEINKSTLSLTNGGNKTYPLGQLEKFVEKIKGKLPHKDLIGLVCLYLLLDADKVDSDIKPEMGIFWKQTSGELFVNDEDEYIPLYGDYEFESIDAPVYPFVRHVIANVSKNKISVKYGESIVELSPNECAVALFCNTNQCYKIFPHIADNHDGLKLCLKFDKSTGKHLLKIHDSNEEFKAPIPYVYSMAIENGRGIYLDTKGVPTSLNGTCYLIDNQFRHFELARKKSEVLLAFEKNNEEYILYTNIRKLDKSDLV